MINYIFLTHSFLYFWYVFVFRRIYNTDNDWVLLQSFGKDEQVIFWEGTQFAGEQEVMYDFPPPLDNLYKKCFFPDIWSLQNVR